MKALTKLTSMLNQKQASLVGNKVAYGTVSLRYAGRKHMVDITTAPRLLRKQIKALLSWYAKKDVTLVTLTKTGIIVNFKDGFETDIKL